MLTTIQFDAKKDLVDEFMQWLYAHSKNDFTLTYVKDSSARFDENGIEYVSDEEQKELEEILKNPDCHEIAYSETVSFDMK